MHGHGHGQPAVGGTVLSFEDLAEQLGADRQGALGDDDRALVDEQLAIVEHQWRQAVTRGLVRGFLLSGPPGVGKTTAAKRLAYELGRRFPRHAGRDGVATVLLDGSEVARAKYGESEQRIRGIFAAAAEGFGLAAQRTVLIFDDVESIFLARGSDQAKEWHYSQDSVFFHVVDGLDTSRVVLVLTTNRRDLIDEAIRDRFLEYPVGYPPAAALLELANRSLADQGLDPAARAAFAAELRPAIADGSVRSLRDAQHAAARFYVARLAGRRAPAVAT